MEIKNYLKIGALALALAGAGYVAGNYSKNREIPKTKKVDNRAEVKKNSLESAADRDMFLPASMVGLYLLFRKGNKN